MLPTVGPGALKSRDDPKLHNTEKERQLLAPQDTLYNVIGKECVELGVCVDFWLFPPPNMYIDVSTLGKSKYRIINCMYTLIFFLRSSAGVDGRRHELFCRL